MRHSLNPQYPCYETDLKCTPQSLRWLSIKWKSLLFHRNIRPIHSRHPKNRTITGTWRSSCKYALYIYKVLIHNLSSVPLQSIRVYRKRQLFDSYWKETAKENVLCCMDVCSWLSTGWWAQVVKGCLKWAGRWCTRQAHLHSPGLARGNPFIFFTFPHRNSTN